MPSGLSLDGGMIPRRVKRLFDQRGEERGEAKGLIARLKWRDRTLEVRLANLSASGAMVVCDEMPHIGERMVLQLADGRAVSGDVCWVRDGRFGIYFATSLE